MIEPGSQLEKIDLSNAGLYGKNWKIGTFTFLSSSPDEALTGFTDSSIKGQSMNETRYKADPGYVFSDVYFEEYSTSDGDGHTEWYTRWNYEAVYEVDSSQQTNIDWKNWGLENLRNSNEAELIMYGNKINFRYFIGSRNLTMGQAVDRGILSEDMIHFEPRVTTQSGYRSNSAFSRLSTSEKNSIRQRLVSNIGGSTYYGCTVTQASDGSITISDITLILVPPSSVKDIIQDYFTLTTMQVKEDITGFLETAEWRNASFVSQSRNAVTENTFSIRMGTRLWDTDGDDGYYDRNPVFVVHKKYKGHAGLGTGLLDKYSAGTLSITGVDGSSVQESTLTNIGAKYGGGTIWLGYDYDSKLTEEGSAAIGGSSGESRSSAKGQSIGDIRNKLIKFKHWDQWTQSASHNGVALIFPFGW